MRLEPALIVAVLAAAAMHAAWNALVKASADRLTTQATVIGVGSLAGLLALPWLPAPAPASWPFLAATVVAHSAYLACLLLAYRHGDLGLVYPLARGIAPLLVAAVAAASIGERLGPLEIAGVILVSAGIVGLSFEGRQRAAPRRAVLWALATGLCIAAYSTIDGAGVRRAGHAAAYLAWMFALTGLPIGLFAVWRRRRAAIVLPRGFWSRAVAGGVVATVAYGIVVWAMQSAAMARVVALRECGVLLAAWIGSSLLGERGGRRRIFAAVTVVVGNLLLQ